MHLTRCGREQSGQARQQGGLAAARWSEQHHHLPVLGGEGQPIERLDQVAARLVLHGEVVDPQCVGHANAPAGSAPVTRRKAEKLEMTPTNTAMMGRDRRAVAVMSTGCVNRRGQEVGHHFGEGRGHQRHHQ